MRVASLVPLYAIFGLIGICVPDTNAYLDPLVIIFESNSLISYFLLLCEYISEDHDQHAEYFTTIILKDRRASKKGVDGAKWFRVSFISPLRRKGNQCSKNGSSPSNSPCSRFSVRSLQKLPSVLAFTAYMKLRLSMPNYGFALVRNRDMQCVDFEADRNRQQRDPSISHYVYLLCHHYSSISNAG